MAIFGTAAGVLLAVAATHPLASDLIGASVAENLFSMRELYIVSGGVSGGVAAATLVSLKQINRVRL